MAKHTRLYEQRILRRGETTYTRPGFSERFTFGVCGLGALVQHDTETRYAYLDLLADARLRYRRPSPRRGTLQEFLRAAGNTAAEALPPAVLEQAGALGVEALPTAVLEHVVTFASTWLFDTNEACEVVGLSLPVALESRAVEDAFRHAQTGGGLAAVTYRAIVHGDRPGPDAARAVATALTKELENKYNRRQAQSMKADALIFAQALGPRLRTMSVAERHELLALLGLEATVAESGAVRASIVVPTAGADMTTAPPGNGYETVSPTGQTSA